MGATKVNQVNRRCARLDAQRLVAVGQVVNRNILGVRRDDAVALRDRLRGLALHMVEGDTTGSGHRRAHHLMIFAAHLLLDANEQRGAVLQQLTRQETEDAERGGVGQLHFDVDDHIGAAVLVQMEAIAGGASHDCRGQRAGATLAVGVRAQPRVGVDHRRRLAEGEMVAALRFVIYVIWRASNDVVYAQVAEGIKHPNLLRGKGRFCLHIAMLPVLSVHPRRVEGSEATYPRPLGHPLGEEVEARLPNILVADAADMGAIERHQVGSAVDVAEGNHDLHRLRHAWPLLTGEHRLLFVT